MLEEMRMAAPRIATYADSKREFLALAERASQLGQILSAGVLPAVCRVLHARLDTFAVAQMTEVGPT